MAYPDHHSYYSPSLSTQKKETFGIYIHIPYCIQRCTYCDFATYVHTEILPPTDYFSLLQKELVTRRSLFPYEKIETLYFGGGTPSLVDADLLTNFIGQIKNEFDFAKNIEITIEINPATINEEKLQKYLSAGVNRFSVGAQTFSDEHLKNVGREHNAQQTLDTLHLLQKNHLNYSFDILFALPHQTMKQLEHDLDVALTMGMKHISPYCLTVPEGHPLSKNRPIDEEQIEMFALIHQRLKQAGFHRYEISNYSLPNYESKHNLLYWTDQSYWGLGLSAHSYLNPHWGTRFWNPNSIKIYEKMEFASHIDPKLSETLEPHQALTDFCHTGLRLMQGLSLKELQKKFGEKALDQCIKIAEKLVTKNLLKLDLADDSHIGADHSHSGHYALTEAGLLISNQIFEEFTFLKEDLI